MRLRIFLILVTLLIYFEANALYGRIPFIIPLSPTAQSIQQAYYFSAMLDYVAGGVSFNYDAGIFTQAPTVRVAVVLKNAVYSTGEVFVPVVVSNDATSALVRVNKVSNGGLVVEAATDDVTLYLLAVGV